MVWSQDLATAWACSLQGICKAGAQKKLEILCQGQGYTTKTIIKQRKYLWVFIWEHGLPAACEEEEVSYLSSSNAATVL
jgi:hypothetical protein